MLVWEELSKDDKLLIAETSKVYGITFDECLRTLNNLNKAMVAFGETCCAVFDKVIKILNDIKETIEQLEFYERK